MRRLLSPWSNLLGIVLVVSPVPWGAAQGPTDWADRLVLILAQPEPPPPGRGPPQSEDEFLEREVWKLREKLEREGGRFDVDRELGRLADRLSRDFGRNASGEDFRLLREELRKRQSTVPPEGLGPRGPPPGKGPPQAPEEFVAHELPKLGEKRLREGERFDPRRELERLWEKYHRDYGQPLPAEDWAALTRALEVSVDYPGAGPQIRARETAPPVSSAAARPSPAAVLPEGYAERDRDRDGQIGLYEWPRRDRGTFARLDLNGDGFVTPQEIQHAQLGRGLPAALSSPESRE